jgi:hypothetical protein
LNILSLLHRVYNKHISIDGENKAKTCGNPYKQEYHTSGHIDLLGDDSWVIVKKQRITILVPPLSAAKKLTTQNLGPDQPQSTAKKTATNQIQLPIDISLQKNGQFLTF